ncbi:MAG TPA: ATP-binding cassette domain-containing protein [Clostridiaceae bacterium]|nr:ATP-binding cassette domain-containing protein [Clostridiaceae bacterium]
MIEIRNLSKQYGNKLALDQVNLQLDRGVYGLLGPNGSGKTTLLRCLAGILRPTCGTTKSPETIGYLPQRFSMYRELTLFEAMAYFASLKKIPRQRQKDEIMRLLSLVHLDDRVKSKVRSLSGGMIRRMGIAQALIGDPPLLLVDEPTAGLDPEERLSFKNLIMNINSEGCVLISTHIVEDVEALCKRIIILNEGRVVIVSSADELKQHAKGVIYSVLAAKQDALRPPFEVLRRERIDGQEMLRVLSLQEQPAESVEPTIEDGYIMHIRGYAAKHT